MKSGAEWKVDVLALKCFSKCKSCFKIKRFLSHVSREELIMVWLGKSSIKHFINALREGQADGSAELKEHSPGFIFGSNQENKIVLNLLFIIAWQRSLTLTLTMFQCYMFCLSLRVETVPDWSTKFHDMFDMV